MTKEALKAWDYDERIWHKTYLQNIETHEESIKKLVRLDEAKIPYSIGAKKFYKDKKTTWSLINCVAFGWHIIYSNRP